MIKILDWIVFFDRDFISTFLHNVYPFSTHKWKIIYFIHSNSYPPTLTTMFMSNRVKTQSTNFIKNLNVKRGNEFIKHRFKSNNCIWDKGSSSSMHNAHGSPSQTLDEIFFIYKLIVFSIIQANSIEDNKWSKNKIKLNSWVIIFVIFIIMWPKRNLLIINYYFITFRN